MILSSLGTARFETTITVFGENPTDDIAIKLEPTRIRKSGVIDAGGTEYDNCILDLFSQSHDYRISKGRVIPSMPTKYVSI